MKKLFLLAGFYCLYLTTDAQSASSHEISFSNKTVKYAHGLMEAGHQSAYALVNARAIQDFRAAYPEVQNETWTVFPDKEILCSFIREGIANRICYTKRGHRKFSITGYEAANLKEEVRDQISNNYKGYHIRYVNEINVKGFPTAYIINIENADHIKVIRVSGDEIEEQQEMVKG